MVTRAGGVVTILTGLPMDWFNQVLIERGEATPAGVLAGVAQARERGDQFVVRLRDGIDDRFIPILTQAGLAPAGEETSTPGMVAFPIDHDAIAQHAAPELEIRRVTDAAGIDAHRQAVTAGFGSDPAVALGTFSTGPSASPTWAAWTVPRSSPGSAGGPAGPLGSTASRRSSQRADAGTGRR
jgi:hypothetical protein